MEYDTEKQGLETVFKPWQAAAWKVFWDLSKPLTSGQVYTQLRLRGVDISRAAVINFLNEMVNEELMNSVEETGKGGHHAVYSLNKGLSEDKLRQVVAGRLIESIRTNLA